MKARSACFALLLFLAGVVAGSAASTKIDPSLYRGKPKKDASRALLEKAKLQAGRGSWERIAVGRVYYLGGMKADGQAIFDDVMAKKPESSDIFRIARVYREAGEWPKAKELFDRYAQANPKDDKGLAEIGAYFVMNGDREGGEALFERSFKLESELWATVAAAGSYVGVAPQE